MLLLLPPSEGKAPTPARGTPLDLGRLSFPELAATREAVLDSLVSLCSGDPLKAREVLGLPPGLAGEVQRNASLAHAPAVPVHRLYTGVLYDALDVASLSPAACRRANRSVVVVSALWGALRLTDRVPPYRLSMDVTLPGLGSLAGLWRPALEQVLPALAGQGAVVDVRSSTYGAAWRPGGELAERTVPVRVLREVEGRRSVVSHMAKHTRGEVAATSSGPEPRRGVPSRSPRRCRAAGRSSSPPRARDARARSTSSCPTDGLRRGRPGRPPASALARTRFLLRSVRTLWRNWPRSRERPLGAAGPC